MGCSCYGDHGRHFVAIVLAAGVRSPIRTESACRISGWYANCLSRAMPVLRGPCPYCIVAMDRATGAYRVYADCDTRPERGWMVSGVWDCRSWHRVGSLALSTFLLYTRLVLDCMHGC